MMCPDDEFLLALASGGLDQEKLAIADSHLDRCESCRALIAELALSMGGNGALPRGAQVDRYIIVDTIGRGAMGTVYRAFDPELDRHVALKLLRDEVSAEGGELLAKEARTMAKVSHPNVVAVYDAGRAAQTVYLAMELVVGRSLRDWLGDSRRSWREVRDVFVAAASGVSAAHDAGVVHRDIKPDNILIADDGTVKVTDFGVASAALSEAGVDVVRTSLFAGTPVYMAPEQLRGEPVTPRSDQFSLCVSLFEALSATRPFAGGDVAEIESSIEAGPPALDARAPRWLAAAITKGLSANAERRFDSVRELSAALTRDRRGSRRNTIIAGFAAVATLAAFIGWQSGESTRLLSPCGGGERRAELTWNPSRALAIRSHLAGTAVTYVGEGGEFAIVALDEWMRRWRSNYGAVCQAAPMNGGERSALFDARMHCLSRRLRDADALIAALESGKQLGSAAEAASELTSSDMCVALSNAELTDPPSEEQSEALATIELRLAEARAARALGDFAGAADAALEIVNAVRTIGYDPSTAEASLFLAQAAASADRFAIAKAAAVEALQSALRSRADDTAAAAFSTLAAIAGETGDLDEARDYVLSADAISARLGRPTALEAPLAITRGMVFMTAGDYPVASNALKAALEIAPVHDRARVLTALGELARLRGDLDEALARHRAALEENRERLGINHPTVAANLHNLAGILRLKGAPEEALPIYRKALVIKQHALGEQHTEVARTQNSIALILIERGELLAAQKQLEVARAIFAAADHPDLATVERTLADVDDRIARSTNKRGPAQKPPAGGYMPDKPWQPDR